MHQFEACIFCLLIPSFYLVLTYHWYRNSLETTTGLRSVDFPYPLRSPLSHSQPGNEALGFSLAPPLSHLCSLSGALQRHRTHITACPSVALRNSSLSGATSLCASHCSFMRQSLCEYVECSYKANIKLEHKNMSTCIFRMALSVLLISTN